MYLTKLKTFLLACALLSLFVFHSSYADSLNTKLSRDKIALGETLTVSYTLNSNGDNTSPDFSVLEKDFRILGTNYGSAVNMINGVTTIQTFWQLTLEPTRAGELIIPEITFGNVKSTPHKLVVEGASHHTSNNDTPVFVEASISNKTPYTQSQVLYTFKLFYQSPLENPRIEIPQIKDAAIIQLGNGKNYQTTIKGKSFLVAEKNFVFFPQKLGKITIPATYFRALTYDIDSNAVNNHLYVATPRTISLATQDFTLDVRNIPGNYQGTTWLPANHISITEKWSNDPNQSWELGNPVTRTITIDAEGLRADQIPDISIDKIPGVNIYLDPAKRSNHEQGLSVTGTLEQKVTYIPNASQSFAIPAVKLNWWNLQTNKNALSQLPSVTVQVKGKISHSVSVSSSPALNAPTIDVAKNVPNQTKKNLLFATLHESKNENKPFYLLIWFWIAIFLFITWLMTLWFIWHKKNSSKIKFNSTVEQTKFTTDVPKLNEENFVQACEQGNAILAQQFLLSWARNECQDKPLNLEKLREISSDENFKEALKNLELSIYAKKTTSWNGQTLLSAYRQVKKQRKNQSPIKFKNNKNRKPDPLPPLNP